MPGGVGYYGKIAALGDFVRRDVPPGFVEAWDPWLQNGMTESRACLGERWFEFYQSAPLWRFALGPGICGPAPVVGIIMASMDRVGRLFPLTLMARLPAEEADAALADEAALLAMEETALDTLDPSGGRAAFDAGVDSLAPPAGAPGLPLSGSHWRSVVDGGACDLRHPGLPPPLAFTAFLDLSPAHWPGYAA